MADEIGASLREARARAGIDISEAEADTKIRGKYLRALENEEWDLLPGPTFVKSFLRTYGDYLGLDGRMLVERFKLRYERPETAPIAPRPYAEPGPGTPGPRGPRPRARTLAVLGMVLALLVGLFLLGRGADDEEQPAGTTRERTSTERVPKTTKTTPAAPRRARLRIVPTGPVYVCLRAAGERTLVDGVILQPGEPTPTYRSSRFRLTLGNGAARLVVNGRTREVPEVDAGIGYEITAKGVRRLPPGRRPTCS